MDKKLKRGWYWVKREYWKTPMIAYYNDCWLLYEGADWILPGEITALHITPLKPPKTNNHEQNN